eukprot:jgi/Astpho2/9829/fgenesh1_pg.00149_%23_75_t
MLIRCAVPLQFAPSSAQTISAAFGKLGVGQARSSAAAMRSPSHVRDDAASAGAAAPSDSGTAPWVDKHAPRSAADLTVHAKKVAEVRTWLELQLRPAQGPTARLGAPRVCVMSGPAGCGKTTVLKVLADSLGFELCTWEAPTPVLWQEHLHQASAGMGGTYTSKMEDFAHFVAHSKYSALPLQSSRAEGALRSSSSPNSAASCQQAGSSQASQGSSSTRQAAWQLVQSARCPVAVLVTDAASQSSSSEKGANAALGTNCGLHKDLLEAIDSAGAQHISFNPLTKLNIEKTLNRIAAAEGVVLPEDAASILAEAASGDLQHATESLQWLSVGKRGCPPLKGGQKKGTKRRRSKSDKTAAAVQGSHPAGLMRDSTLSAFHALGKFLYNKRVPPGEEGRGLPQSASQAAEVVMGSGLLDRVRQQRAADSTSAPAIAERLQRRPLTFDPEAVLMQSGLEAASVAAFLHESMHAFINEQGAEGASVALEYFSSAGKPPGVDDTHGDVMLQQQHWGSSEWQSDQYNAQSLQEAAAGSVAARGLCFANAHPAPTRFLPLRKPSVFMVQRAARANQAALQESLWSNTGRLGFSFIASPAVYATEALPILRLLSTSGSDHADLLLPACWTTIWQGEMHTKRWQQSVANSQALEAEELHGEAIED